MIIGIVGSEGAKFTEVGEQRARDTIRGLIAKATKVVSGHCHLGGIDIWAIEEAEKAGIPWEEYEPTSFTWGGPNGFQARNRAIAEASDRVVSIVVRTLPKDFKAGGWEFFCYHCATAEHIKSGGCWTAKYAREIGKEGYTVVVENE